MGFLQRSAGVPVVCRAEACLCWFTNLCPGSVQDLASSGVSPSSWMPAIPSFQLICTLSRGRWSWAGSELTISGISFPCPLGYVVAFPIAHRAHSTPMAQPRSLAVCARVPLFTIFEGTITALTCGPPPWSERSRGVIDRWLDCFGPHDCFHPSSCSLAYSTAALANTGLPLPWSLLAECRALGGVS